MSADIRDYIREFDRDFEIDPEKAGKARRPGVDSLKDGTYTFTVQQAESDVVTDEKRPIVRLVLKVEDSGDTIEHTYWLNNQVSVNILGQDLLTLGFDSDKWDGRRRTFSEELHKILKDGSLKGLKFKAKKVTDEVKGKTYHRLYINWPLGRAGTSSEKKDRPSGIDFGALGRQQPARPQEEEFAAVGGDDDEIPF